MEILAQELAGKLLKPQTTTAQSIGGDSLKALQQKEAI
jgi:hypothetical protein